MLLAPYACHPDEGRGRLVPEPASPTRSDYQRDRDRILHSAAFRRLNHKTQVFIHHEGDHYRSRLTHSLEVSQIARALARSLRLQEDLAEAIALAHDLGHPPFGHAGERALARVMQGRGGFDHNVQSFRVVTSLEGRYASFDGLNLTAETLEGLAKHNGPVGEGEAMRAAAGLWAGAAGLDLGRQAPAEAQAAAIADDIAYNSHDIDDGLRAGLFTVADIAGGVGLIGQLSGEVLERHPGLDTGRLIHEIVRRVITRLVEDVLGEAARRLDRLAPKRPEDLRSAAAPVIAFSAAMQGEIEALRGFLFTRMYRHSRVMRVMETAEGVVERLFAGFLERPERLPAEWQQRVAANEGRLARVVADYIAGMTDRFALAEHRRLFDGAPELR